MKSFRGEENDVLVVFLALIEVRTTGDGVGLAHGGSGLVMEREVVVLEFRIPSGLATVQLLRFAEVGQVLVVRPDLDGGLRSEQILSPFLQADDHGHELLVVDLVVPFGLVQGLGEVSEGVPLLVLELRQDGAEGEVGGIALDSEG